MKDFRSFVVIILISCLILCSNSLKIKKQALKLEHAEKDHPEKPSIEKIQAQVEKDAELIADIYREELQNIDPEVVKIEVNKALKEMGVMTPEEQEVADEVLDLALQHVEKGKEVKPEVESLLQTRTGLKTKGLFSWIAKAVKKVAVTLKDTFTAPFRG